MYALTSACIRHIDIILDAGPDSLEVRDRPQCPPVLLSGRPDPVQILLRSAQQWERLLGQVGIKCSANTSPKGIPKHALQGL